MKVAGSGAVDPDVSDYNGRSLEVAVVVPDVPCGSGRSLEVVAVVPDVPLLTVVAVVPGVSGGS